MREGGAGDGVGAAAADGEPVGWEQAWRGCAGAVSAQAGAGASLSLPWMGA